MMLTLNDGRSELWQWDTGRTLAVDADCSQVHFSNKVFGRSIDVDVIDGSAIIPDVLLQTDKELNVWAFVGTAENGYTKISKTFKVNRRNKPADYVFTPPDQTSLEEIKERVSYLESMQDPGAIKNAVEDYLERNPVEAPVQSVNGHTGQVNLTANDVGAISQDNLQDATDKALAQAKASGEFDGAPGADGHTPEYGVDYGTPEQISGIAQSAADILQPELNQIKDDLSDNAKSDAETKRILNALWKLNQGISYQFETDDTEAYRKTAPSGAKLASVEQIGGKTVMWNQLARPFIETVNTGGVSFTKNQDGFTYTIIGIGEEISWPYIKVYNMDIKEHNIYALFYNQEYKAPTLLGGHTIKDTSEGCIIFISSVASSTYGIDFTIKKDVQYDLAYWYANMLDLTAMFGSGNEPVSTADPRIAWLKQYAAEHPVYNAGQLVSADVESIKYSDVVAAGIPAEVRNLPGYGWSAGDLYNSIERTEIGWQYVQRVASRAYQDGDVVTDGVTTYYALNNPVIIDITDLIDGMMDAISVETGGTLTFESAAKLPVPSSVEYAVKLSEVNG